MKRALIEQAVLFASILKWFILATLIGVVVGLSTTAFLKLLAYSELNVRSWTNSYFLLPVGLLFSGWIVRRFAPEARGHGTEKVIEAVHKRSSHISASVVPVKLVATIATIASGGSAGKEGPCAQIGAALASMISSLFRFYDHDRKKLVICGISAGFASVFGTPIAGAIFGVEVLVVGTILYDVLLPSFISGIVAYQVSSALGITYFYNPIYFVPDFTEKFFIYVVFAGVFFGICSFLLIEGIEFFERLSKRIRLRGPFRNMLAGIVLVGITYFTSTRYLGLGLDVIESSLHGAKSLWYDPILKLVFTGVTLNFGGSGGILTPVFFIGSSAGNIFAQVFGLNAPAFSAIGLISLLAGAANTPIAASIMAVELFGSKLAPYATVAAVISFLMTGHRSVYPSQVLAMRKSPSIQVEMGKEMEDIHAAYKPRGRSFASILLKAYEKWWFLRNKKKNPPKAPPKE